MLDRNKKPISVLFILNSLSIGGNETSALALAKNLDKNLFNPKILVLSRSSLDMEYDFVSNNIELIYANSEFSSTISFCLEFFTILKKHEIKSVMLYSFTYQLVLLQFVSILALVRYRILRISGSPNDEKLMRKLFFIQLVARFTITREVVVSNAVFNWASRIKGFPMKRVSVIFNGINSEDESCVIKPREGGKMQVIMVSRMDEAKDQFTLISAMKIVQKKIPKATLTLVGDGPLKHKLERHSKRIGCKTSFLGFKRSVNLLLSQSSVFVLSTKTEGFPNALLEAMSSGLPVIASEIQPCSEILNKGEFGLLFKVGCAIELSNIIIDLLENNNKRLIWADKAKKRSKDFNMVDMVNRYQKILYEHPEAK